MGKFPKFPKDKGVFKHVLPLKEQEARRERLERLKAVAGAGVAANKGSVAAASGENAPLHVGYVKFAT